MWKLTTGVILATLLFVAADRQLYAGARDDGDSLQSTYDRADHRDKPGGGATFAARWDGMFQEPRSVPLPRPRPHLVLVAQTGRGSYRLNCTYAQ